MMTLPHSVKVYCPSQSSANIPPESFSLWRDKTAELSRLFGGATGYTGKGYWQGESGLVTEDVTVIESFASESAFNISRSEVIAWAENLRLTLGQEAIAVQFDGQLTIVD